MALVYMYRIKVPPGMYAPKVLVDGDVVTTLPNNAYTWFYLSPGTHTIKTKWIGFAGVPDIEFVANVVAQQTYYLKMEGSVRSWGVGVIKTFTAIKEVAESVALVDLERSKKYAPAGAQAASAEASSEPEGAATIPVEKAPAPPAGYATVYIYRPDSPPKIRSPKILVDGQEMLKLANKAFSWFYVPAGSRTVATRWGSFERALEKQLSFTVENGRTYYVRAGGTRSMQGTYDAFHTSLDLVDENLAGKEMQKISRYVPSASQTP